jgi:hypothetical protein
LTAAVVFAGVFGDGFFGVLFFAVGLAFGIGGWKLTGISSLLAEPVSRPDGNDVTRSFSAFDLGSVRSFRAPARA